MRSLLVDRVLEMDTTSISGRKFLSINEDIYEYHFPKNPVMPAAYMVEGAVQLGRILVWKQTQFQRTLIPLTFKKFKFHKMLRPGTTLDTSLTFMDVSGEFQLLDENKVKVIGSSNNEVVFEGTFVCKIVDFEDIHHLESSENYVQYLFEERH